MDAARFEELLRLWQDGQSSPPELNELEGLLRDRRELRQALVGAMLLEDALYRRYAGAHETPRAFDGRIGRKRIWEGAAAMLAIAVSLVAVTRLLTLRVDAPVARVISGAVWSKGAPAPSLQSGQAFEIHGLDPATLLLEDGTRVLLDGGSAGRLPGETTPFELTQGSGTFQIAGAGRPVRITTPSGSLSVRDAQFRLALHPFWHKSAKRPELTVEAIQGRVEVDAWDTRATVAAGSRRTFGPPPPSGGIDYRRLLERATFGLSTAVRRALEILGGVPLQAQIEEEDGRQVFSVKVAREKKVREVALDLATGQILEDEEEPEDGSALAAAVGIPLGTLIEKTEAALHGQAVEAEFELHNGRLRAEIKIYSPDGLREVKVDGRSGEILSSKTVNPGSEDQ